MIGPVRANTADVEYIMPVHWPSLALPLGTCSKILESEAGGNPITAPEKAPKITTKAIAAGTVRVVIHKSRISSEDTNVTVAWTLSAPKCSERYAEPRRPTVDEAFMMLRR